MSILQKVLAEFGDPTEARGAMNGSGARCNPDFSRAFIAAFVSAAFLWTLALSVSPQLHERIHPDANRIEHTCAVTFIASGSYNHSVPAPLVAAPVPAVQFSQIPALNPRSVPSPFLGASIFEHAPPARS